MGFAKLNITTKIEQAGEPKKLDWSCVQSGITRHYINFGYLSGAGNSATLNLSGKNMLVVRNVSAATPTSGNKIYLLQSGNALSLVSSFSRLSTTQCCVLPIGRRPYYHLVTSAKQKVYYEYLYY
jgi:hypothetical protein